jgi:beta-aspartyl-peptidase (threonine type)
MEAAMLKGYRILEGGGSSLDAVEAATVVLENHPDFNAGVGSRLQLDGRIRMDASIMEGDGLKAGAVAAIEDIANPIRVARAVMDATDHVMLVGEKAKRFALSKGFEEADVYTERRRKSWERSLRDGHRHHRIYREVFGGGTVGAVAIDQMGKITSGSSTGGGVHMLPGRVGDTPIIGAGIYADSKSGGVSATGPGEDIVRSVLSKTIADYIDGGKSPNRALKAGLKRLHSITEGYAGAIAMDWRGRVGVQHTSPHMYYSYRTSRGDSATGARIG